MKTDKVLTDQEIEVLKRYQAKCHAMQTGVAMVMNFDQHETTPKHLRTGVNVAMSDHGALVDMLVEQGIIDRLEYFKRLEKFMDQEVEVYVNIIQNKTGKKVTLV